MLRLSAERYEFLDPPDGDWLPSPYSLFDEVVPTPAQIHFQCQKIQAGWDEREKKLRRLRAELACQFGVCRNL